MFVRFIMCSFINTLFIIEINNDHLRWHQAYIKRRNHQKAMFINAK